MADTTTAYSLMVADLGYTGTDIPAETKTLMEAKLAAALVQLAAKGITLDLAAPTDNELLCSRMRPVLSEPEIESLLQSAAGESISWIDDPNERKQVFAQILSGGDRRRVLHLIRMLYVRRRELQKNGKHLRIADEQTLRDAEKLLNDEFAHVLHIPQQDVPDYIRSRMEREA